MHIPSSAVYFSVPRNIYLFLKIAITLSSYQWDRSFQIYPWCIRKRPFNVLSEVEIVLLLGLIMELMTRYVYPLSIRSYFRFFNFPVEFLLILIYDLGCVDQRMKDIFSLPRGGKTWNVNNILYTEVFYIPSWINYTTFLSTEGRIL
jgi:hypothetical protein